MHGENIFLHNGKRVLFHMGFGIGHFYAIFLKCFHNFKIYSSFYRGDLALLIGKLLMFLLRSIIFDRIGIGEY